jgi:hypothetical protein
MAIIVGMVILVFAIALVVHNQKDQSKGKIGKSNPKTANFIFSLGDDD